MDIALKIEIAKELKTYMDHHNLAQIDIAKLCEVPKEHVNRILKKDSKFTYNAGKAGIGMIPVYYFHKIAEHIGFQIDKSFWDIQPTYQTNNTLAYLQDAKDHGYTNVIIGETGAGKTFTSNLFVKKHPADAFLVTCAKTDNISDLLDKLIDAIRLKTNTRKNGAHIRAIVKYLLKLKEAGRNPVIIFDEGEFINQHQYCAIKELYDNLNGKCGMIIIGTPQIIKNIERMKKRNLDGIPQFYRRIKFGIRNLPLIDRSFKIFLNEIEDPNLKRFLKIYCENYGELHDIIVPARREAERLKEPLTLTLARKVLNLPDTEYPI